MASEMALDFRNERFRTTGPVAEVAKPPAIRRDEHYSWESADTHRFHEIVICLLLIARECLVMGEIDFDKDEVIPRVLLEPRLIEHFRFQPFTPDAPVGASEVQKDGFIFAIRFFQSGVEIGQPFDAIGSACSQEHDQREQR